MRDDVRSIDDLVKKLKEKGYGVNLKKYLSIKSSLTEKPFVHTDLVTDIFLNILLIALSIKTLKCRYQR